MQAGPQILTVKKSSILGTIFPMVLLIGGVIAISVGLLGIWVLPMGNGVAASLIFFGALLAVVNALNLITLVRCQVELSDDGSATFRYPRRFVNCQLAQVSVISTPLPSPDSTWPVRFRTPKGWVRVCRQLPDVEHLVQAVRAANPEVELRGSAGELIPPAR